MFCIHCGKEIPEGSNVCLYCNDSVSVVKEKAEDLDQKSWKRTRIFGTELILVRSLALSIICIVINLLTIDDKYHPADGISYSSAFLLILPIILAVLWIAHKRAQGILIGILGGQLISVIIFFMGYRDLVKSAGFRLKIDSESVITVFTFAILFCLGSAVCGGIHFFSKYNLGKVTVILSLCSAFLLFALVFIMYFWVYGSEASYFEYVQRLTSENNFSEYMQGRFPQGGYVLHAISMAWLSLIVALYTMEFFRGRIYNEKDKIYIITMNKMDHVASVVMQKAGEKIGTRIDVKTEMKGEDVQCSIQYNQSENTYGITVCSDTAIFVNGGRLPKGVVIEYPAGITLAIGTEKHQIYLG